MTTLKPLGHKLIVLTRDQEGQEEGQGEATSGGDLFKCFN